MSKKYLVYINRPELLYTGIKGGCNTITLSSAYGGVRGNSIFFKQCLRINIHFYKFYKLSVESLCDLLLISYRFCTIS